MDHLYKQILAFQHRSNDYIDDPTHHVATSLKQAVQRLEDDVQVKKNPHSVEGQIKRVLQLLEKASEDSVMSHHHADELIKQCEEFIQDLRKLR